MARSPDVSKFVYNRFELKMIDDVRKTPKYRNMILNLIKCNWRGVY
jgi:hypothetical protein